MVACSRKAERIYPGGLQQYTYALLRGMYALQPGSLWPGTSDNVSTVMGVGKCKDPNDNCLQAVR